MEQLRAEVADLKQQRAAEADRHRAEVERLAAALERAQTLHLAGIGELQDLRRKAAELEEQNRRLIEGVSEGAASGRDAPSRPSDAPESGEGATGGVIGRQEAPEGRQEGDKQATVTGQQHRRRRPWWRFWGEGEGG